MGDEVMVIGTSGIVVSECYKSGLIRLFVDDGRCDYYGPQDQ